MNINYKIYLEWFWWVWAKNFGYVFIDFDYQAFYKFDVLSSRYIFCTEVDKQQHLGRGWGLINY